MEDISWKGGKNCCVPGCTNSQGKTYGTMPAISYMSFPKDTPDNHEWREKLVIAVARQDQKFDPAKHHICTDHFERSHLLFSGRGLKIAKGRLPSLNLPHKSVEVRKLPPRTKPVS
ncbi:PREDICTED: uncharacterized protein LOC106817735 [Priapulus caudatus]|uniref:Uncharacterized protein LOC106817735 n=1 Tax=Priapulus caudatus TaxID=37621 RepID=A0ABM1F0D5_PRICU|nr:PREDICTED: uncharacterized protein LOC106817735 [Priapulus caudatus]